MPVRRASPLLILIMVLLALVAGESTPAGVRGSAAGAEDDSDGWRWAAIDPAGWRWE
jgi:hypothetical protein